LLASWVQLNVSRQSGSWFFRNISVFWNFSCDSHLGPVSRSCRCIFLLKGHPVSGCNWWNGQSPGSCGSQVLAGESNRQQRWFLQRPNSRKKSW
jgi:hypothetical protein